MSDPAPTTSMPWHALDAGQAVARLDSDAGRGLSDGEVARRVAEHGPNALPEAAKRPLYLVFLRQSPARASIVWEASPCSRSP